MNRILAAALLATSALAAAAPALAQPYGPPPGGGYDHHDGDRGDDHHDGDRGYDHHDGDRGGDHDRGPGYGGGDFWAAAPHSPRERVEWLSSRIDRGLADGSLDRHQAYRARHELTSVRAVGRQLYYRDHGQLNGADNAYLQQRLDRVRDMLHFVEHRNEQRAY